MAAFRYHFRLPWFALAAIVGMLSMVGEASARTTNGSKSCCVVPSPPACCCCPAKAEPSPDSIGPRTSSIAGDTRVSEPTRSCECRSDDPAAPASQPKSSSTEPRHERANEETIATAFSVRPLASFARFTPPTGSPPKSPLYLLTTRLLI